MLKTVLSSKIHKARVTGASVHYEGSLSIDADLLSACGMVPYEKILVSNMDNANRFETYAICAAAGSREIKLNGAAAHLGKPGDMLTIMSFALASPEEMQTHIPRIIVLDENNNIAMRK